MWELISLGGFILEWEGRLALGTSEGLADCQASLWGESFDGVTPKFQSLFKGLYPGILAFTPVALFLRKHFFHFPGEEPQTFRLVAKAGLSDAVRAHWGGQAGEAERWIPRAQAPPVLHTCPLQDKRLCKHLLLWPLLWLIHIMPVPHFRLQ